MASLTPGRTLAEYKLYKFIGGSAGCGQRLFIYFRSHQNSLNRIVYFDILLNKFLIFDQYEYIHCRILDFNRHMFGVICLQSQFFANEQ